MAIYALADLHLSLSNPEKSMELFGKQWAGYIDRIVEGWNRTVKPEDTVLIPGDISWATYIEKAEEDFSFISSLPGRKLLSRGNHDYWWTTMKKLDEFFESHSFPGMELVRTNVIEAEDCLITGTRGWMTDSAKSEDPDKKKTRGSVRYRIPQVCKVTFSCDGQPLLQTRLPFYQLGVESSLFLTSR